MRHLVGVGLHTEDVFEAAAHVPAGWPAEVPPPGVSGWEVDAASWLLDRCPADYRRHEAWRRHPVALGWIAERHVEAEVDVMRQAYRRARVELREHLRPEAVTDVLVALEEEGLRLRATAHATHLVAEALRGATFRPRL